MPKISVILPVYNGEAFVAQAVQSILEQQFNDFELLIIDDGSTDSTKTILDTFTDKRIKRITHRTNQGLIASLNEGIEKATSQLIARMDADDISLPERLQQQYDYLKTNSKVVLLGTEASVIDASSNWRYDQTSLHSDAALRRLLTVACPFVHGSVVFRKEAVTAVGGYRNTAYAAEDYDLWIRLSKQGEIANLPEILYQWRINPAGESLTKAAIQREACRRLGDAYWSEFGEVGPAPQEHWRSVWPISELERQPVMQRRRQLAHFHIYFARGYRVRGQYGLAMAHLKAAWQMIPSFWQFYFYYLLLPILPSSLFLFIEGKLLDWRLSHQ